jgi:hypothetical protein
VAESRARLAEVVRPDVEVVLAHLAKDDPLAADDEAAPQWAYSREQLVTSLLIDFEPCLDLVRKLADCDAAELTQAISSFPVLPWLLSARVRPDRDVARRGGRLDQHDRRVGHTRRPGRVRAGQRGGSNSCTSPPRSRPAKTGSARRGWSSA